MCFCVYAYLCNHVMMVVSLYSESLQVQYVKTFIYISTYIHTYMHTYIHMYIHTYIYTRGSIPMRKGWLLPHTQQRNESSIYETPIYIHTYIHACIHTRGSIPMRKGWLLPHTQQPNESSIYEAPIYIHTYIHTYIHAAVFQCARAGYCLIPNNGMNQVFMKPQYTYVPKPDTKECDCATGFISVTSSTSGRGQASDGLMFTVKVCMHSPSLCFVYVWYICMYMHFFA